jgi:hypothetical protein
MFSFFKHLTFSGFPILVFSETIQNILNVENIDSSQAQGFGLRILCSYFSTKRIANVVESNIPRGEKYYSCRKINNC